MMYRFGHMDDMIGRSAEKSFKGEASYFICWESIFFCGRTRPPWDLIGNSNDMILNSVKELLH